MRKTDFSKGGLTIEGLIEPQFILSMFLNFRPNFSFMFMHVELT